MHHPQDEIDPVTGELLYRSANYKEMQAAIYVAEKRKTRNKIFSVAALWFSADLWNLYMMDFLSSFMLVFILVAPLILIGIAVLAMAEPVIAVIIAFLIVITFTITGYFSVSSTSDISGILIKVVIIFLLLSAYKSARDAGKAEKVLSGL